MEKDQKIQFMSMYSNYPIDKSSSIEYRAMEDYWKSMIYVHARLLLFSAFGYKAMAIHVHLTDCFTFL